MNEHPPTVIHDTHLAGTMAYAEKPYQDLALSAEENGLPAEAADLRAKADVAGNSAGIAQVESSRLALLALQALNNAEGRQAAELGFLSEISPEDEIAAPKLGKNGGKVVARAVATLATLPADQRYAARIVRETGFATGTVGKIIDELETAGLVSEAGKSQSTGGPKPTLFSPTEQLDRYLRNVPEWRRAYNLRVMAERLGRDEAGTMDYLLAVGESTLRTAASSDSK